MFPRVGFIVTDLNKRCTNVVKFYNGRGTADQRREERGEVDEALVVDNATRETRLGRSESDAALEIRDVPTCQIACDTEVVRSDSRPH